jgi:cell division protein FtsA
MRKKSNTFLVAGLDIGTSKIHALIAQCNQHMMEIIALGTSPSEGLKRGIVMHIDATTQSIRQAIMEAEKMANVKINQVYTGIAGSHIRSLNSYGSVAIQNNEVTQSDIDAVMKSAQTVKIPPDQTLLHTLPQEFIIDSQQGIRDPLGMSGMRLEAKAHIITGAVNAAQNIIKCVQRCGVGVADVVLEQLASSQSVLTEDEKELGVCLLDIGGGSTDIALFIGGTIRHTATIPIAGDHVTRDIAVLLHASIESAESVKKKHASVFPNITKKEWIEISSMSDQMKHSIPKDALAEVVGARYEELFKLVRQELQSFGYWDQIPAGIVLTGGASHVGNALELAQQIFQKPIRHGFPHYHGNMGAMLRHGSHATGVGLICYGYQHTLNSVPVSTFQSIYQRMKSWFRVNL